MQNGFDHGPRLTDEEYDQRIVKLHSNLPPSRTKEQDRELRLQELNLAIDHRLGKDFPQERRDALWVIQQEVEKKRLRLTLHYLFRRVFSKSLASKAQGLAGFMVDEYAKVLTKAELESFFGLQEGQRPVLPVDEEQVKK